MILDRLSGIEDGIPPGQLDWSIPLHQPLKPVDGVNRICRLGGVVYMQRVRITLPHNERDPADDLRRAARLRRVLWAKAVEIDPDSPAHRTQRDAGRNAYFEFATNMLPVVRQVMAEGGHSDHVKIEILQEGEGTECINCGNIPPQALTVCPVCHFRDIDACPYCNREVPRLEYASLGGDLFQCPNCGRHVRFGFHEFAIDDDGRFKEPLVLVSPAEAPSENAVR
jgi:hypothetical protein